MNTTIQKRSTLVLLGIGFLAIGWVGSQGSRVASPRYDVPEVDLSRAKALVEAGAVVIDVRGQDPFDYRHLPAAVLVPLAVLRAGIPLALSQAKDKQIVVYCNDGHTSGPEATQILLQHGFKDVVNIKSGIEGWANAGLPIVKGH